MKKLTPSVSVRADKSKRTEEGTPVFIFVAWKGTRAKEAAGRRYTDQEVKKKAWKADRAIRARMDEIEARAAELMMGGADFTAKDCLNKPRESVLAIREVVEELCRVKRLELGTCKVYLSMVAAFEPWFGDVELGSLTLPQLQGWAKGIKANPSTVGLYLSKLHSVLEYAATTGKIKKNVMQGWRYRADGYKGDNRPRALDRGDVSVITNRYYSETDKKIKLALACWLTGYWFNGMALADIMGTDWSNVEERLMNGSRYYCLTIRRRKTKAPAHIVTPVTKLTAELVELMKTRPWVKVRQFPRSVNRGLDKVMPGLTYYSCRHTFASMMVRGRAPINTIASMMGRSVDGISAYISRISEPEALAGTADILRKSELLETPPEDLFD